MKIHKSIKKQKHIYIYIYIYELAVFYLSLVHLIRGRLRNGVAPRNLTKTNAFCHRSQKAASPIAKRCTSAPISATQPSNPAATFHYHQWYWAIWIHFGLHQSVPQSTRSCELILQTFCPRSAHVLPTFCSRSAWTQQPSPNWSITCH